MWHSRRAPLCHDGLVAPGDCGAHAVGLPSASRSPSSAEDGWAHLATVGSIITKHGLDFDSRTYGYAKLSDLLPGSHLPREMDW